MKGILRAAAAAAALTLVGGAAYAADCFSEMMDKTNTMITDAEKRGDMTNAAEARRLSAEAKRLHDEGQGDAALVRIVRGMMLVERTPGGGH